MWIRHKLINICVKCHISTINLIVDSGVIINVIEIVCLYHILFSSLVDVVFYLRLNIYQYD